MKERLKKLCAVFIAVYITIVAVPQVAVSAEAPATYSKEYNSGTRHEVCTSLDGTSASSYYTGEYTYDNLSELSSGDLKTSLSTLMTTTHTYKSTYADCHYKANRTDCENGDGSVSLIYTSYSATMSQWNGWNREHVWPKSLGGKNDSDGGGGADLHHIRPSDAGVNSSRGNKKYGESGSNATEKKGTDPAVGVLGGTYNSTYFEPLDNVKGDVARICLYVYVRWGADWGATDITKVFQSVEVLLDWCELDPVDTWEMGRNEVIQDIQGNRNVFIDYPEFAWLIFEEEVPTDMVTPSGRASNGTAGGNTGGSTGGDTDGGDDTVEHTDIEKIKAGATGKEYTAEGVVVGVNAKSYLLGDSTGVMLVYLNSAPSVSVGDKVQVTGNTSVYGGAVQFGQDSTTKKIGVEQVVHPTVKVLSGADCNKYLNSVTMDYVTVVGTLAKSGNYYNLSIEGANITGSVTYPANTGELTAFLNKKVEVTGYITGVTGSGTKYLNIMMTDISEYDGVVGSCQHPSTRVEGYVSENCAEPGYSGDTYCTSCNEKIFSGEVIEPNGEHSWSDWRESDDVTQEERQCSVCYATEYRPVEVPETEPAVDTEPETEPETDPVMETDPATEPETEDLNTEPETDRETEKETEANNEVSTTVEPGTGPETAASNGAQSNATVGCASSLAGGTVAISVISIATLFVTRRKKD